MLFSEYHLAGLWCLNYISNNPHNNAEVVTIIVISLSQVKVKLREVKKLANLISQSLSDKAQYCGLCFLFPTSLGFAAENPRLRGGKTGTTHSFLGIERARALEHWCHSIWSTVFPSKADFTAPTLTHN